MKLLLVRLSSMGDLIHTLPALTDLSRQCPDIELHWLCEAAFADIARLHPFVRTVHTMRWRQWRKRLFQAAVWREIGSLKTALRGEGYERVLDSQGLVKSALSARLAAAPTDGLDRHSAREPIASWFYRHRYPVDRARDAVWRNRTLFGRAFGYTPEGAPDFGLRVPESAQGSLKTRFAEAGGLPEAYHVALHATSRDSKLWPQQNWTALLAAQYRRDGLPVLLPWGSEAERQRAQALADALPHARPCPRLSLSEAAALLQGARAAVGVDTGLLHLANAAGTPLVGIYTDSDPVRTGVQLSPRAPQLGGIGLCPTPEAVLSALAECIAAKQAA